MTAAEFKDLKRGDIVRHKIGGDSFVVDANRGDHVTAVRTVDMTQPNEWDLVVKSNLEFPSLIEE